MPTNRQRARRVETLGIILIALLIFVITVARFWRAIHFHLGSPR